MVSSRRELFHRPDWTKHWREKINNFNGNALSQPVYWLTAATKSGAIATIGDQPSDVLMFREAGVSISMGQSSDEVKKSATYVSPGGLDDEGFARALEKFILDE